VGTLATMVQPLSLATAKARASTCSGAMPVSTGRGRVRGTLQRGRRCAGSRGLGMSQNTGSPPVASATAPVADDMADAKVRTVDKDAAKLTLKHGEIKSLEMPPMTMVFNVKDKAMLDQLKAGDKVRFKAVNEAGKYTVTDIQVARRGATGELPRRAPTSPIPAPHEHARPTVYAHGADREFRLRFAGAQTVHVDATSLTTLPSVGCRTRLGLRPSIESPSPR